MKTQSQHDAERSGEYAKRFEFEPRTGIACDGCKIELLYTDEVIRMSMPPKRQVICLGCGAISFIIA